MTRQDINQSLELFLLFLFGLSISVWKPGIYVSSGLILAYALVRLLSDGPYRKELFAGWIAWASMGLFLLGVIATWIHPGFFEDTSLYARKAMFLLLIPVLLIAFKRPANRHFGLAGFLVGFWIASAMTFDAMGWQWQGLRVSGTWTVDVWGVISSMAIAFLTPFLFHRQSLHQKLFYALTCVLAVMMLVISGGRAPLFAAIASLGLFLLLHHRRTMILLLAATALAYWPLKQLTPGPFQTVERMVTSVITLNNQQPNSVHKESNLVRINLWTLGIAHNQEKIENSPLSFVFGSGPENHLDEIRAFFERTDALTDSQKQFLRNLDYPSNDLHNMYLDTVAKMGIIWTVLALTYLIAFCIHCIRLSRPEDRRPLGGLLLLFNFLLIGFFYDIMLHFAPFFLVFLMTLSARSGSQSGTYGTAALNRQN